MRRILLLLLFVISTVGLQATNGALTGKFTINADGDQVFFSQGNLQAVTGDLGAHWTWRFAANQWDYIGDATANNAVNGFNSVSANGTVDLFAFSTTGPTYGIHNSCGRGDYIGDFVDWGTNAISNGGNEANLWRTLTKDEWNYLLNTRVNCADLRGPATVNNVHGCILLPDNWLIPDGLSFTPNASGWTVNVYDATQWSQMENAGAVFLPAAGQVSKVLRREIAYVGDLGFYWSTTGDYHGFSEAVSVDEAGASMTTMENWEASSVRLVHDAEKIVDSVEIVVACPKAGDEIIFGKPFSYTKDVNLTSVLTFTAGYDEEAFFCRAADFYDINSPALTPRTVSLMPNTDYYMRLVVRTKDGYYFPNVVSKMNVTVNGEAPVELSAWDTEHREIMIHVCFNSGMVTAIDNIQSDDVQCTKILRDGQVVIQRGEKTYTIQGQEVR